MAGQPAPGPSDLDFLVGNLTVGQSLSASQVPASQRQYLRELHPFADSYPNVAEQRNECIVTLLWELRRGFRLIS